LTLLDQIEGKYIDVEAKVIVDNEQIDS